jgi:hypothetical protein
MRDVLSDLGGGKRRRHTPDGDPLREGRVLWPGKDGSQAVLTDEQDAQVRLAGFFRHDRKVSDLGEQVLTQGLRLVDEQ